ncbi:hypothetical protein DOT_4686 [Desulfosporosinus sp. OT]|nr:hypothetical protein DOT_4686 [Desulfosporosinus sp. OT]
MAAKVRNLNIVTNLMNFGVFTTSTSDIIIETAWHYVKIWDNIRSGSMYKNHCIKTDKA